MKVQYVNGCTQFFTPAFAQGRDPIFWLFENRQRVVEAYVDPHGERILLADPSSLAPLWRDVFPTKYWGRGEAQSLLYKLRWEKREGIAAAIILGWQEYLRAEGGAPDLLRALEEAREQLESPRGGRSLGLEELVSVARKRCGLEEPDEPRMVRLMLRRKTDWTGVCAIASAMMGTHEGQGPFKEDLVYITDSSFGGRDWVTEGPAADVVDHDFGSWLGWDEIQSRSFWWQSATSKAEITAVPIPNTDGPGGRGWLWDITFHGTPDLTRRESKYLDIFLAQARRNDFRHPLARRR